MPGMQWMKWSFVLWGLLLLWRPVEKPRGGHTQLPPTVFAQVTSQLVKAHRKSWETSGMDRWMLKVKTPPAHPGVIKLQYNIMTPVIHPHPNDIFFHQLVDGSKVVMWTSRCLELGSSESQGLSVIQLHHLVSTEDDQCLHPWCL